MAAMAATAPATDKTIRIARFFSYPKVLVYVLIGLLGLVSLIHFLRLSLRLVFPQHPTRPDGWRYKRPLLRRWPLAAVDWIRAKSMRKTLRLLWGAQINWLEGAVTVGYLALLLGFLFAGTTTLEGQLVEPHYYANRAGTIAASQFPIMTALGMRNNPFSWLTGISFDKLNYLHRMTARVLVIIVWIHAGGRLTVGLLDDETINHPWVRAGFLAATTLTLLALITFRPVRRKAYEWFMVIHFVGAGITLLALLKHLTGRSLTKYGAWPSLLLWGVDRALRGLQYLFYNHPYFTPGSKETGRRACDAEVEVLRVRKRPATARAEEGDARVGANDVEEDDEEEPRFLRITLRRARFRWRPGQSAFLAFPSVGVPPVFASSVPAKPATDMTQPGTTMVSSPAEAQPGPSARASGAPGDRGAPSSYAPSTNPLSTHPFQSHPFTIMAYDDVSPYHEAWGPAWGFRFSSLFSCFSRKKDANQVKDGEREKDASESGGSVEGGAEKGKETPDSEDLYGFNGALGPRGGERPSTLVFVVRVREGMTRALWDRAAAAGRAVTDDMEKGRRGGAGEDDGESASADSKAEEVDYGGTGLKCTVPAFISGPYSNPPVLVGYHTVMLIAGGTGVAFTLPLFLDVIERAKRGEPSCEQLVFIWSVRDIDHLKWIEEAVLQAVSTVPESTPLTVRYLFCITGRDEDTAPTVLPVPAPNLEADAALEAMKKRRKQEDDEDPWKDAIFKPTPKQRQEFAKDAKREARAAERRMVQARLVAAEGAPSEYVPTNASPVSSWSSLRLVVKSMLQLPNVRVVKTKPPIRRLMQFELEQCQGRLSVNVCGTPSLANSVREVLSQERMDDVMSFGPTVTLHVEAFGG